MKSLIALMLAAGASVLAYCHAHPLLIAGFVSMALSQVHESALLAKVPRLQAVAKLAAAVGWDLPKIQSAVVQLLTGVVPAPAAPSNPPPVSP